MNPDPNLWAEIPKVIVNMTKAEFNKVNKYLKTKIPHYKFKLEKNNV